MRMLLKEGARLITFWNIAKTTENATNNVRGERTDEIKEGLTHVNEKPAHGSQRLFHRTRNLRYLGEVRNQVGEVYPGAL